MSILLFFAVIVQIILYRRKARFDYAAERATSKLTAVMADSLANNFTILTFGSYAKELSYFDRFLQEWFRISRIAWRKHPLIGALVSLFIFIMQITVLYVMIRLWSVGSLTVGTIMLVQMYFIKITDKTFQVGNMLKKLVFALSESTEMIHILDTKHDIQDAPDSVLLDVKNGAIDFTDVSFSYEKDQQVQNKETVQQKEREKTWIFQNFHLHIAPKEKVALVGHSGSGKTTFVKLLFRFFDIQQGCISIDGQDIAKVTQQSLRNHISMVPQDPLLFHRSLKENIAYGRPDASMDEIIAASKMARCHEFIETLEHGYETFVGER